MFFCGLATKSGPRNPQHDEKDTTTLEPVLAYTQYEQLRQMYTHTHLFWVNFPAYICI